MLNVFVFAVLNKILSTWHVSTLLDKTAPSICNSRARWRGDFERHQIKKKMEGIDEVNMSYLQANAYEAGAMSASTWV